MSSTKLFN